MQTEITKRYTVAQAAKELGVSGSKIYKLINEREIGCIRIGATYRFKQEHIDAYIEQNEQVMICRKPQNSDSNSDEKKDHGTYSGPRLAKPDAQARGRQMRQKHSDSSQTL